MMIRQRCLLRCDQQGCHHTTPLTACCSNNLISEFLLEKLSLDNCIVDTKLLMNYQLSTTKTFPLNVSRVSLPAFYKKNCLLNDFQCWKSIWIKLSVDEKKEVVMFSFPSRAWNIITWSNSFFQHNDIVKSYQQFTIIL